MGALKGRGLPPRLGAAKSRLKRAGSVKGDAPMRRSVRPIKTAAWQKARAQFIKERALAAADRGDVLRCEQTGVALMGKHPAPNSPVVDHKIPDRGDLTMFWDRENWQVVSKEWHDRVKQSREKRGEV